MAKRRGHNEGSIYQDKDGRWRGAVTLQDGRRRYLSGKTRQEVARKLTDALKAAKDGVNVPSGQKTLAIFLAEWLETLRPPVLRPTTWTRYEEQVRLHIVPALGKRRLSALEPHQIQRLYADKLAAGLAANSVRHMHAVLHRALKKAVEWRQVGTNAADAVTPPAEGRAESLTLTAEQGRHFLRSVAGDPLEAFYTLALWTGMRQGELLALRWRDVDLERKAIKLNGTLSRATRTVAPPKTKRSRRFIPLVEPTVQPLRRHRLRQADARHRAGEVWRDNDYVFAAPDGGPIIATHLNDQQFYPALARAGLPRVRFHDLRHTTATLLLEAGVHPAIVADLLGHSTVSMTLDRYSHVSEGMVRSAMAAMEGVLGPSAAPFAASEGQEPAETVC